MCVRAMLPPSSLAEPVSWRGCAQSFPGQCEQVRSARVFLAGFLGQSPGSGDVAVLVSELATNACVHSVSGTPGGRFTVRAEHCPGLCIHVEVEDQGSDWNGDLGTAEPPHGLYLLRELSSQCGTRRGDYGWVIWFTLAITT